MVIRRVTKLTDFTRVQFVYQATGMCFCVAKDYIKRKGCLHVPSDVFAFGIDRRY